jgi:DNA-binding Lrp family transcriptional regulator
VLEIYRLDGTERKIMDYVTENAHATPKEIARAVDTDEQTARRLYNRLFAENACSQVILPNYAMLGFKVMIIQKLKVKNKSLPDVAFIKAKIESEWTNCIDCHETFDGKIFVRSVWKNAEEFKDARIRLHQKHGMEWLSGEEVDMVPLNEQRSIFRVKSLWENEVETEEPTE